MDQRLPCNGSKSPQQLLDSARPHITLLSQLHARMSWTRRGQLLNREVWMPHQNPWHHTLLEQLERSRAIAKNCVYTSVIGKKLIEVIGSNRVRLNRAIEATWTSTAR